MQPGALVDRYRIERSIGRGGMGEVFEAFDPKLDRLIALKIVSDRDDGRDVVARATKEAQAAARLSHPNAVAIFDVGAVPETGLGYIAMELVRGVPMRQWIGDTSLPMGTRIRWLMQLADALSAAHRLGIVHRDVKPDNVLIDDSGQAKMLDFGVAKVLSNGASVESSPGTFAGTPRYMAPEQLVGARVDGRTDQFAWGLVAYELLSSGHPAMRDREVGRAPRQHLAEVVRFLQRDVADVVMRAMAADPAGRHPSMDPIARALVPYASSTLDSVPRPRVADSGAATAAAPTTTLGPSTRTIDRTAEQTSEGPAEASVQRAPTAPNPPAMMIAPPNVAAPAHADPRAPQPVTAPHVAPFPAPTDPRASGPKWNLHPAPSISGNYGPEPFAGSPPAPSSGRAGIVALFVALGVLGLFGLSAAGVVGYMHHTGALDEPTATGKSPPAPAVPAAPAAPSADSRTGGAASLPAVTSTGGAAPKNVAPSNAGRAVPPVGAPAPTKPLPKCADLRKQRQGGNGRVASDTDRPPPLAEPCVE